MSLIGTLSKVALGIAVAKGVGKVMGGNSGNSGSGGGGLGGLLGSALGGASGGSSGAGGLGGLLGSALGGASGGSSGAGGLGELLGSALGGAQGGSRGGATGGLGGLLESLGGAASGGAAAGGLGDLLNSALQGKALPQQPDQKTEETAKILIQAMVNAAKSDGQIDKAEQERIVSNLGNDVSEQERQFVIQEMQSPLDFDGFVRSIPRGAEQQVYLMSVMGIDLDSQAEAQYLDKLRQTIGLSQEACNNIHQQLGVPTLYG